VLRLLRHIMALSVTIFLVSCGSDDDTNTEVQGLSTPSNISVVPAE